MVLFLISAWMISNYYNRLQLDYL